MEATETNCTAIRDAPRRILERCHKIDVALETAQIEADKEVGVDKARLEYEERGEERRIELERYKARGDVLKAMIDITSDIVSGFSYWGIRREGGF